MVAKGKGSIVNIASMSGLVANRGIGGRSYETTKAAMIHFTRCAGADWAPHGITVNAICPGYIATEMVKAIDEQILNTKIIPQIPAGRLGEPDDFIGSIIFLSAPASDFMTGHIMYVDGGFVTV